MPDAVVIGAGPNGLVAANVLAERGWEVCVLEAAGEPGGAVRSGALTLPGFTHDLMSAFYPLAAFSPAIRRLALERHGLEWCEGELALAHPAADGSCPVLARDVARTVASLDPGDRVAWRRLDALWERIRDPFGALVASPFPPLRGAAGVVRRLGPRETLRLARLLALSARRLAEEEFRGERARRLLVGNALHADVTPEAAGGAGFGFLLCMLARSHGFPFPRGGAGGLSAAMARRLEGLGGRILCGRPVSSVLVRRGRAVGVRTEDGEELGARRAVLADTGAPALYRELLPPRDLPPGLLRDVARFHYDHGTVKVDWALAAPIPWSAGDARRAPVVHVAESVAELSDEAAAVAAGRLAERPFLVMGQYAAADPSRQPPGRETAWAYTRVPNGFADGEALERLVERMEARVEALAPGFCDLVLARHVFTPAGLEAADRNLVGGAIHGGTAQLHQQAIFRPVPGLGRPETPVRGLFLASASAHPGGGVHGACGANAARAALWHDRIRVRRRG